MIRLSKLRAMRSAVRRFAVETEASADGDLRSAWSDKDEAHRSLLEAEIYLSGWITHRELHRADPKPGGLNHDPQSDQLP